MVRSAAARLAIGLVNLTVTGCATPTISPFAGRTDAMVTPAVDVDNDARLMALDAEMAIAMVPTTTTTHRITRRIASIPSTMVEPPGSQFDSSTVVYSLTSLSTYLHSRGKSVFHCATIRLALSDGSRRVPHYATEGRASISLGLSMPMTQRQPPLATPSRPTHMHPIMPSSTAPSRLTPSPSTLGLEYRGICQVRVR
jgi:hypothetical protein